jgi:hypothetical protein
MHFWDHYEVWALADSAVPSTQRREASMMKAALMWTMIFVKETPASLLQSE